MELTNEFTVPLPPERAWAVLTDLERIAPCVPGARLTEIEGGEHRGEMKVKVGPITATYKGAAHLEASDEAEQRAVLRAEGSDARQGSASATVTATLAPEGSGTRVTLVTDLSVGGKVAQLGRGVLVDVSAKVLDQFAECLSGQLEAEHLVDQSVDALLEDGGPSPKVVEFAKAVVEANPGGEPDGATNGAGVRRVDSGEPVPVNLLDAARAPVARRLAPVGGVLAALAGLILLLRRLRR